jgi:hypothetical protein
MTAHGALSCKDDGMWLSKWFMEKKIVRVASYPDD